MNCFCNSRTLIRFVKLIALNGLLTPGFAGLAEVDKRTDLNQLSEQYFIIPKNGHQYLAALVTLYLSNSIKMPSKELSCCLVPEHY